MLKLKHGQAPKPGAGSLVTPLGETVSWYKYDNYSPGPRKGTGVIHFSPLLTKPNCPSMIDLSDANWMLLANHTLLSSTTELQVLRNSEVLKVTSSQGGMPRYDFIDTGSAPEEVQKAKLRGRRSAQTQSGSHMLRNRSSAR